KVSAPESLPANDAPRAPPIAPARSSASAGGPPSTPPNTPVPAPRDRLAGTPMAWPCPRPPTRPPPLRLCHRVATAPRRRPPHNRAPPCHRPAGPRSGCRPTLAAERLPGPPHQNRRTGTNGGSGIWRESELLRHIIASFHDVFGRFSYNK